VHEDEEEPTITIEKPAKDADHGEDQQGQGEHDAENNLGMEMQQGASNFNGGFAFDQMNVNGSNMNYGDPNQMQMMMMMNNGMMPNNFNFSMMGKSNLCQVVSWSHWC